MRVIARVSPEEFSDVEKVPSRVQLDGLALPVHFPVLPDDIRTFWCTFLQL